MRSRQVSDADQERAGDLAAGEDERLAEEPAPLLAVPGMVVGSPGMEGTPKRAYDVLTFDAAGHTTVYEKR